MYFSVKKEIKLGGKVFIPCVCYAVTVPLELTVKKLAKEGRAVIYEERVFFQNGKVIEKKPAVKEVLTTEKKSSKKSKKEEKVEPKDFVKEAEEIVTTDESEGF